MVHTCRKRSTYQHVPAWVVRSTPPHTGSRGVHTLGRGVHGTQWQAVRWWDVGYMYVLVVRCACTCRSTRDRIHTGAGLLAGGGTLQATTGAGRGEVLAGFIM
jgi:hypothetical protein